MQNERHVAHADPSLIAILHSEFFILSIFWPETNMSSSPVVTTFENLLFEKRNSIAYVTVNRPKVLNALNMATMEELRRVFHAIKDDAEIRVVIFTGAGEKAFIAG